MLPEVRLAEVTKEDVKRIAEWLQDPEVNASWYGASEEGQPVHMGYVPQNMLKATETEWSERLIEQPLPGMEGQMELPFPAMELSNRGLVQGLRRGDQPEHCGR